MSNLAGLGWPLQTWWTGNLRGFHTKRLTEYAHLHYLCSKMVAALFVFLWNFLAKKFLLFHR